MMNGSIKILEVYDSTTASLSVCYFGPTLANEQLDKIYQLPNWREAECVTLGDYECWTFRGITKKQLESVLNMPVLKTWIEVEIPYTNHPNFIRLIQKLGGETFNRSDSIMVHGLTESQILGVKRELTSNQLRERLNEVLKRRDKIIQEMQQLGMEP